MAVVNMAVSNIESIMADNEQASPPVSGLAIDQFDEINKMAEAIRNKMDNDTKTQNDA
jgi:hypothetical protein